MKWSTVKDGTDESQSIYATGWRSYGVHGYQTCRIVAKMALGEVKIAVKSEG